MLTVAEMGEIRFFGAVFWGPHFSFLLKNVGFIWRQGVQNGMQPLRILNISSFRVENWDIALRIIESVYFSSWTM